MNLTATLQGLPDLATRPAMQRVARALPSLTTGCLTIVIAWQLAKLTWALWPQPPESPVFMPSTLPTTTVNRVNTQRIADAHIFGLATASSEPSDAANAQLTSLPLVLTGVMATREPTQGFAFIGESPALSKFKRVGDTLPGGARLHSVYMDRVMLDRGGKLEALMLPRFRTGSVPPPLVVAQQPTQTRFAENVRRIAETNPAAFSEMIRPQPVFEGSVQRGYRVYPGRNRQQFAKLGLQPGDLVTAVNGTPLTDQANSMQIFNTISTSDRVTLTVERGGKMQTLNVNTALIELPDDGTGMPPQDPMGPGNTNQTLIQ